jgi:hypothetical protein
MDNVKARKKSRHPLSKGQHRLLKESLKQLLGHGLLQQEPQRTEREMRAQFLRDALSSRILDEEWLG